jgi:glycosyltransferase involved in cell wall biosynthesis
MMNEEPLISVIVVSYNSANFIIETLDSIYNQKYDQIELIIADDCSTDSTAEVVMQWALVKKNRFSNYIFDVAKKNSGISANLNRGLKYANGKWIKLIAADDILLPDCLLTNVDFIKNNPSARIVHSSSYYYQQDFKPENFLYERKVQDEQIARSLDPKYQLFILKWAPSINAPSVFIEKKLLDEVGNYDTDIASFDDWPMWLKISRTNVSIFTMNKVTVCYRMNPNSFSNKNRDSKLYSNIYKILYEFSRKYLFSELSWIDRFFKNYEFLVLSCIDYVGLNKKKLLNKTIYLILISPYYIYNKYRYLFA